MKEAANMPEGARIVPRLQKHEEAISLWRYEGPYAFYNAPEPYRALRPGEPAGADAFAWIDAGGTVLGHVSYGPDGRIPTVEGYPYSEDCLDVGLRLRPDLCGRGLGEAFIALCLGFGAERYGADRFRLSVAAFNARAVRAYQRAGFSIECEVTNSVFRNTFYIMTGARAGA